MADPITATLAIGALVGGYQQKRTGDKAKRAEEKQKELEMQPSEDELLEAARKRSALARSRARGGFGLQDTIRTGTLGNVSGGNSTLGAAY